MRLPALILTLLALPVSACALSSETAGASAADLSANGVAVANGAASWVLEATAPPQAACDPHTSCPPVFSFSERTLAGTSIVYGASAFAYADGHFQQLFDDEGAEPMLGASLQDIYGVDPAGVFHWNGTSIKRLSLAGEPFTLPLLRDDTGALLISVRQEDPFGSGGARVYLLRAVWDGVSDTASSASEVTCNGAPVEPWNGWTSGQDLLVRDGARGWVHLTDGACNRLPSTTAEDPGGSGGVWEMDIVGKGVSDLWATEHEVLEHFDGSTWSVVAKAPAGDPNHLIGSLVVLGPSDVWTGLAPDFGTANAPSVGHWNGASFEVVPLPGAASSHGTHVWGTDSDHLWAVTDDGKVYRFHH
jgi:hypothetical protein